MMLWTDIYTQIYILEEYDLYDFMKQQMIEQSAVNHFMV